jgi:hypothetical protein
MRIELANSGPIKKMKSCARSWPSSVETGARWRNFFLEELSRHANIDGLMLKLEKVDQKLS